jgi:dephospho-CoA kinase
VGATRRGPFVLGVTGGIGSGKTTVARMLAESGARVLDADGIVRAMYAGGDVPRRIARRFGPGVLGEDGSVDRAALARAVFPDAAAREDLEAIVHPEVRRRVEAGIAELREAGYDGIVVVDAALLVEAAPPYPLDALLVVTASRETRLARLEARGVPRDEAARRMAAQTSEAERTARADVVVVNDGSLEELARRVEAAIRELGRDAGPRSGYTGRPPRETPGGRE